MTGNFVIAGAGIGALTAALAPLGDAAHPMYPVGADGGSQAHGLHRYENRRRPETAKLVKANREMHRTRATRRPTDLARVTAKYRADMTWSHA
jgi:hypothetical protein